MPRQAARRPEGERGVPRMYLAKGYDRLHRCTSDPRKPLGYAESG
jgi:hypothetical protein